MSRRQHRDNDRAGELFVAAGRVRYTALLSSKSLASSELAANWLNWMGSHLSSSFSGNELDGVTPFFFVF
jgi:hypothetical protein